MFEYIIYIILFNVNNIKIFYQTEFIQYELKVPVNELTVNFGKSLKVTITFTICVS